MGNKSSGGSQRRKASKARKQSGAKGLSAYMAKQNMPYSQTMPGPKMRVRRIFDGFRQVNEYTEAADVAQTGRR